MHKRFTDKIVLITGAGSGIGRSTALAFASEGAKLIVADFDETGGERPSPRFKSRGMKPCSSGRMSLSRPMSLR